MLDPPLFVLSIEGLGAGSRPCTQTLCWLLGNWRIEFDSVLIVDEGKNAAVPAFGNDYRFANKLVYKGATWLRKLWIWQIS
jgi:hypothetical protein